MSVRPALHLVGAAILLAGPGVSQAQIPGLEPEQEESRSCELIENQWVFIRVLGENNRNSYVSGPLEARCEGGIRIQADSAVIYEASGYTQLFDNVMFEDPEKQLTSDRANYFSEDRRLIALGRGRVVDKVRQSVMTGDTIVYSRARPPFRLQDVLSVRGGEPHAILFPPEPEPEPAAAEPEIETPDSAAADTLASPDPDTEPSGDSAVVAPDSAVAEPLPGPDPETEPPGDSAVAAPDSAVADPLGTPEPGAAVDAAAALPDEEGRDPAVADSVGAPEPGAAVDTTAATPAVDTPDPTAADSLDTPEPGATADTTGIAADSAAIDPVRGQPPSEVQPRVPADSTDVPPDAGAAAPDSLAADVRPPPPLRPRRRVPYDVDAEVFTIVGDREFLAVGDVVIRRDSLEAFGDSLRFDQVSGDIVLTGDARIEEATFDLTGDEVRLGETPEGVQEVRAVGDAVLLGDQVDLTAPEIRIFLVDGALDVLVATSRGGPAPDPASPAEGPRPGAAGPGRGGRPTPESAETAEADSLAEDSGPKQARAITEDFVLTGDSIEVIAPGEMLETVTAIGSARGESEARDSLNTEQTPEVARRDWLEGRQITAYFEPLDSVPPPVPDTTDERPPVRIDRIVAIGNARSLYRMTPSDTAGGAQPGQLAVHYVLGDTITLTLLAGALEGMDVSGSVRGYHVEPLAQTVATAQPDSLAPDTMAVPPDSAAGAPPDTTLGPPPDTTGAEGTPPDTTTVADTIPDVGRDATPRAALEMAPEKGRVTSTTDPPWARRREHP